jgi:serine protease inhibitor
MKAAVSLLSASLAGLVAAHAADSKIAAGAVNALGVDLYRVSVHGDSNLLLSPYSIQNALAMTYAGADGETRTEMQRVLHFPTDDEALHGSFSALAQDLAAAAADSAPPPLWNSISPTVSSRSAGMIFAHRFWIW